MNDGPRNTNVSNPDPGISSVLAHRLAHEVRSPLGVVQGALQQIISSDDSSAAMARLAHRSCARLLRLADRLDRIAALDETRPSGQDRATALAAVLEAAVGRATAACARSRIEVSIDITSDTDIPWRLAEALATAVEELVHNAISHARARVDVTAEVSSPSDGSPMLRITVADDGRGHGGAAPTFRPPTTVGSGLGLGLWLAKAVLVEHHATLELHPGDETGTRAEVGLQLPLTEAE